jgi:hypothetical protein
MIRLYVLLITTLILIATFGEAAIARVGSGGPV